MRTNAHSVASALWQKAGLSPTNLLLIGVSSLLIGAVYSVLGKFLWFAAVPMLTALFFWIYTRLMRVITDEREQGTHEVLMASGVQRQDYLLGNALAVGVCVALMVLPFRLGTLLLPAHIEGIGEWVLEVLLVLPWLFWLFYGVVYSVVTARTLQAAQSASQYILLAAITVLVLPIYLLVLNTSTRPWVVQAGTWVLENRFWLVVVSWLIWLVGLVWQRSKERLRVR